MLILFFHFYTISLTVPFKYNSLSGFAPKRFSNFLFPFQYFLPPRHQQMGRNDAVPPFCSACSPTLSSLTPVLSSASLPASWHRPVVPEMLREDQEKKKCYSGEPVQVYFFPLKKIISWGWGDGSVGEVLAVQTVGPEFRFPEPVRARLECISHLYKSSTPF